MSLAIERLLVGAITGGVELGTCLLFAALGEIFLERSGIMNLGLEGIMALGALVSFWVTYVSSNPWLGIIAGLAVGVLLGVLMGILCISLHSNQIVVGMAISLFGIGLSLFLNKAWFGANVPLIKGFEGIYIPLLSEIPILGSILSGHTIFVYVGLALVPIWSIILFRTRFGLRIRAVGENPEAADSLGINVYRIRYLCIAFGGCMAGLAGAYLTIGYLSMYSDWIIAGRGWIALIIVIFSRWRPWYALGSAVLFGFVDALQMRLQLLITEAPTQLFLMMPYLVALVALLITYKGERPPSALGTPYIRRGR